MTDLECSLQERSTAELQNSLKIKGLTDEAAAIAREVLRRRGANVPDSVPEEELEEGFIEAMSNSNRNFLITLALLVLWASYAFATGKFESGQQERLNQSIKITGLLIASVWGWSIIGKKK